MIRANLVLRNVIGKPLRTFIVIISLAAAAFAALFCIAGINSAKNDLRDFFSSNYGETNIMIMSGKGIKVKESDLPPGSRLVSQAVGKVVYTVPYKKYFNYVDTTDINVVGIDTKLAYELKMIESPYPTDGGITITEPLSKIIGKTKGDTFTFYADEEREYSLKILEVVPAKRFLTPLPMSMVVSPEVCNEIAGQKEGTYATAYAAVPSEMVAETINNLSEKYRDHAFMGSTSLDSDAAMSSMLNIYYLIFAVVLLMVCFIVVSMSKHIVNERMSVIGMLRSVGGSIRDTGLLLLAESAFYGLCGGVIGSLLFLPFRSSVTLGIFSPPSEWEIEKNDGINFFTILLVILGVILIQCLFSLSAIAKASKTPVRDIIFGSKDSVYIPSKIFTLVGVVLLVIGIILFVLFDGFEMMIISAFSSMIGAVLVFPVIIRFVSKLLKKLFDKANMPLAKLAVTETYTTKSSVSSSQLILSAMSLTIAMLVISMSLLTYLSANIFDANVLITSPEENGELYTNSLKYIDGVQDVECLYFKSMMYDSKAIVNGEERELSMLGLNEGGFRNFNGVVNCPESLSENEAAIDKVLAQKLSLNVGDEITITLEKDSYMPRELKLKIKSMIDCGYFNTYGNTVMINSGVYKSIYYDNPYLVLVKTDPMKVEQVRSKMVETLSDDSTSIKMDYEYYAEQEQNMSSILGIVYAVVILGVVLSLLGTSSNMLMGFEQSRRKFAVYYSIALGRKRLKKLILVQTMVIGGISSLFSVIFGSYFLYITNKALESLNMSVPLADPFIYAFLFGIAAFAVLLIAAVKPMKMVSKMNVAEEIKSL